MTKFEESLREVFQRGARQRRAKGIGTSGAEPFKRKDGTRWVGPKRYKVTKWLYPWHYGDVMVEAERQRISMDKLIDNLIEQHVPHVTARPTKTPGKVIPINRARKAVARNVPPRQKVAAHG